MPRYGRRGRLSGSCDWRDWEVDLHGLRRAEAEEVVHRSINDHWVGGWRLHFITGDSDGMRDVVRRVAGCYGLEAVEDDWNPGVVVVRTWAVQRRRRGV